LEVTLNKRLNGLGFSFLVPELEPSKGDSGSGLVRIKKLFPGQPAEESGRIQEGDVILAVNGEPLKGLSYQVNIDADWCDVIRLFNRSSRWELACCIWGWVGTLEDGDIVEIVV
jgi:hypothetical protein